MKMNKILTYLRNQIIGEPLKMPPKPWWMKDRHLLFYTTLKENKQEMIDVIFSPSQLWEFIKENEEPTSKHS